MARSKRPKRMPPGATDDGLWTTRIGLKTWDTPHLSLRSRAPMKADRVCYDVTSFLAAVRSAPQGHTILLDEAGSPQWGLFEKAKEAARDIRTLGTAMGWLHGKQAWFEKQGYASETEALFEQVAKGAAELAMIRGLLMDLLNVARAGASLVPEGYMRGRRRH